MGTQKDRELGDGYRDQYESPIGRGCGGNSRDRDPGRNEQVDRSRSGPRDRHAPDHSNRFTKRRSENESPQAAEVLARAARGALDSGPHHATGEKPGGGPKKAAQQPIRAVIDGIGERLGDGDRGVRQDGRRYPDRRESLSRGGAGERSEYGEADKRMTHRNPK